MLKILQTRFQLYVIHEHPDVQAGDLEKAEDCQIANIFWIIKKERELQKTIYFCFTDYAKAFDYLDHIKCGKFWKRWEY